MTFSRLVGFIITAVILLSPAISAASKCDFTKKFSSLPDAVALDLDDRYREWKLGLTSTLAIVPAECFEMVDGLIVY